jgi:hypothetical protein
MLLHPRHASIMMILCALLLSSAAFSAKPAGSVQHRTLAVEQEAVSELADYLTTRDLLIEGTITAADTLERERIGGCGISGLGPVRALDLTIRISRVRIGIADDSTIVISVIAPPAFASGPLIAGTNVLAWAAHECDDGWRLWGNLAVLTPNGFVILPNDWRRTPTPSSGPLTYARLDSALAVPALAMVSSPQVFEASENIALMRVSATTRVDDETGSFQCDSIGWVMGNGATVPRYVDWHLMENCYPEITVGDSIIVPLPSSFSGQRLTLQSCPRALRVRYRYVRGLGVPLEFLPYALSRNAEGLHVRPYISRE